MLRVAALGLVLATVAYIYQPCPPTALPTSGSNGTLAPFACRTLTQWTNCNVSLSIVLMLLWSSLDWVKRRLLGLHHLREGVPLHRRLRALHLCPRWLRRSHRRVQLWFV